MLRNTIFCCSQMSVKGWEAHLGDLIVSGKWLVTETSYKSLQSLHINILELKAVFLAKAFQTCLQNKRVLVTSDNATVVSYLNKQRGPTR